MRRSFLRHVEVKKCYEWSLVCGNVLVIPREPFAVCAFNLAHEIAQRGVHNARAVRFAENAPTVLVPKTYVFVFERAPDLREPIVVFAFRDGLFRAVFPRDSRTSRKPLLKIPDCEQLRVRKGFVRIRDLIVCHFCLPPFLYFVLIL